MAICLAFAACGGGSGSSASAVPDICPDLLPITCQFQVVGQAVPLAGTGLSLNYSSARQSGRHVAPSDPGLSDIGGWTISTVDHLDVAHGIIFGGDGSRRVVTPVAAGDELLVVNPTDGAIDVFDKNGREERQIDSLTRITVQTFTYDGDRLASITNFDGATAFQYDVDGKPSAIVAPNGTAISVALDGTGALASVLDPRGQSHRMLYQDGLLLTTITGSDGVTKSFTYDGDGRVATITNGDGRVTTYSRTQNGSSVNVAASASGNGTLTWTVEKSQNGWTYSQVSASGRKASVNVTDTARQTTLADGTMIDETLSADSQWGMQAPLVVADVTTPSGTKIHASEQREAARANPLDPADASRSVTVDGKVTATSFTASTSTVSEATPDGRTTLAVLSDFGRIVKAQRAGFAAVAYEYDSHNRLTKITEGAGQDARIYAVSWDDTAGQLSLTDPTGATSVLAYGALGVPQAFQRADGQRTVLDLSGSGSPIGVSVNGEQVFTLGTNAAGQLTSFAPVDRANVDATVISYNNGRRASVTNPDSTGVSYQYDNNGRLTAVNAGDGDYTPTYASNGVVSGWTGPGNEAEMLARDGNQVMGSTWTGPVSGALTVQRNGLGEITSYALGDNPPVAITYNDAAALTGIGDLSLQRNQTSGLPTATTAGGVTTATTFDQFGARAQTSASYQSTPLFQQTLHRDSAGRLASIDETVNGQVSTLSYTYDSGGRLASVTDSAGALTLGYDGKDNLTSLSGSRSDSFTVDARNQVVSDGASTYEWTSAGTLKSVTSGGQKTQLTTNGVGQLIDATLPDGRAVSYIYDPAGRLLGRIVNGQLAQGFLYLTGDRLPIAEVGPNGKVIESFTYAGIGAPAEIQKDGHTYRVISDHLGSPRLIVDEASGQVAEQLDYDVLGNVTRDTNPGFQPFGFTGGLVDPYTNFVQIGVRNYDPAIGRWTSRDRALLRSGSANLYEYANDDWVNRVDLSGRDPVDPEAEILVQILTPEPDAAPASQPQPNSSQPQPNSSSANDLPEVGDGWYPGQYVLNRGNDSEGEAPGTDNAGADGVVSPGGDAAEHESGEGATGESEAESPWGPGVNAGLEFGLEKALEGLYESSGGALGAGAGVAGPVVGALVGGAEIGKGAAGLVNREGSKLGHAGEILSGLGSIFLPYGLLTGNPIIIGAAAAALVVGGIMQIAASGDPHFRSADGNRYDYQGAGEFALTHDPGGGFDVQVRLEPKGTSRLVSVITAAAVSFGDGHRVGVYRGAQHELLIDGAPVDLSVGSVNIGSSAKVTRSLSGEYIISTNDGKNTIEVVPRSGDSLKLAMAVDPARGALLQGLGGSLDGNASNDFTARDGTISTNSDFASIRQFGESWRISQSDSLFDYDHGKSTDTYTDKTFPDKEATVNDVPADARQTAEVICRGVGIHDEKVLTNCILDVGLLKDPSFAADAVQMNNATFAAAAGTQPTVSNRQTFTIQAGAAVGPDSPSAGAGRIEQADAMDDYLVTDATGDAVYAAAAPGCTPGKLTWQARSSSGSGSGGAHDICEDLGRIVFDSASPWTIEVASRDGGTDDYSFSLEQSEADQRFTVAAGQSVSPGQPGVGAGSIDRPGGRDLYEISGNAGDAVYIAASQNCSVSGIKWQLVSPDGSAGGIAGLCSDRGVVRFDVAGTSTVIVTADGAQTGHYSFDVLQSEPVQTFSLSIPAAVGRDQPSPGAGHIDRPGGQDRYEFSGSSGMSLAITASKPCTSPRLQWYLQRPNGSLLGGITDICSLDIGTVTLDAPGTWAIVVDSNGGTGDYGFKIGTG